MNKRIQLDQTEPKAMEAMYALENFLEQSELSETHKELIKIRASQINRCAFCIDMHTKQALNNGEDLQRIFLLDAWRDSSLFTEEEGIILQLTEELTLIHQKGLTDECYQKAINSFDKQYVSQLIMAITTINAWNRIAISTQKPIAS